VHAAAAEAAGDHAAQRSDQIDLMFSSVANYRTESSIVPLSKRKDLPNEGLGRPYHIVLAVDVSHKQTNAELHDQGGSNVRQSYDWSFGSNCRGRRVLNDGSQREFEDSSRSIRSGAIVSSAISLCAHVEQIILRSAVLRSPVTDGLSSDNW
jgi:hypothetical protein